MKRSGKNKFFKTRVSKIIVLNLAIALVLGIIFWMLQNRTSSESLSEELISSLFHGIFYGLSFGLLMPYFGERLSLLRTPWNWILIIISLLLIAFISSLLIEFSLLGLGLLNFEDFRHEYFFKSLSVFFIALLIGLGVYFYELFHDRVQATNLQLRTQELEKERAVKLAAEARLASLESKLHPHFLFNTLNSISALISEDPLLADQMVQRLASFLRASLDACEQSKVTLTDEITLIVDYLEIEKTRFRERLSYEISLKPEIKGISVPPLILLPIVENSVKFAIMPNPAGGSIKISGRVKDKKMYIEIEDTGPGFTKEMIPRGHGLNNLELRLDALYGQVSDLTVNLRNGKTIVAVSLPLNDFQ